MSLLSSFYLAFAYFCGLLTFLLTRAFSCAMFASSEEKDAVVRRVGHVIRILLLVAFATLTIYFGSRPFAPLLK